MKQISGSSSQASKSVITTPILVSPDSLSPTLSTSPSTKTPKNTDDEPDDTKPAHGDIQMEYSPGYWYDPSIRAVTKSYL